jgi:hypothetical protein
MVRYLLSNNLVEENDAIQRASQNGHIEVVKLLLSDKRDLSAK